MSFYKSSKVKTPYILLASLAIMTVGFQFETKNSFFIPVAQAQIATQDVTLSNIVLDMGTIVYRIPKMTVLGSNFTKSEIEALYTANKEPLHLALARLSAREVQIPELTLEQQIAKDKTVTTYQNLIFTDIKEGRMTKGIAEKATFATSKGKGPDINGTFGRFEINDVDVPFIAQLYGTSNNGATSDMKRAYGRFVMENILLGNKEGMDIKIASISGEDFKARLTKDSWGSFLKQAENSDKFDKMSADERKKLIHSAVDLLTAYDIGSFEMKGMLVKSTKSDKDGEMKIDRIAYRPKTASGLGEVRVEGLNFGGKQGKGSLESVVFSGFSMNGSLDAVRDIFSRDDTAIAAMNPQEFRRLIPNIGFIKLSNLEAEVLDKQKAKNAKKEAPVLNKVSLKQAEFIADHTINGIPTKNGLSLTNFVFNIPENSDEQGLKNLLALGYKNINVSSAFGLDWNEQTSEIALKNFSFQGENMGSFNVKAVLGNATKNLFNVDSAVAMVAAIGATVKNLDIQIANQGLFDRLLEQQAKIDKKTPEELRRDYGMAAAVMMPAILGASENAKKLTDAVSAFIAKPGQLNISAKTKDEKGLGFADFMAAQSNPASLLEKVDVQTSTQ